jgi:hypothetical protein
MHRLALVGVLLLAVSGCAMESPYGGPIQPPLAFYANPAFLATGNHECVWENVVDVVDDYFPIEREEPVRLVGNVLTEGRLDTFPNVGSTIFEPWRQDSVTAYDKLESTLQSIRRHAVVRVIPADQGFWVEVAVFKELEDVVGANPSTPGGAVFPHHASLTRVVGPVDQQEINAGWIPQGRDAALEQRILEQVMARMSAVPMR